MQLKVERRPEERERERAEPSEQKLLRADLRPVNHLLYLSMTFDLYSRTAA